MMKPSAALAALVLAAAAHGVAAVCAGGCALTGTGVCAASGVTFANECLAKCAGVAIAYAGPCRAPNASNGAGAASAAASGTATIGQDPTGQFLTLDGAATGPPAASAAAPDDGSGTPTRTASAADLARFAAEGFSLVGAARLGKFKVTKPAGPPGGKAAVAAAAAAARGEGGPVFTVRVLPEEGLVYVSSTPLTGPATGKTSAVSPGTPPTPTAAPALATARPAAAAAETAALGGTARAVTPLAGRRLKAPGWNEIITVLQAPYTAIGWLEVESDDGSGSICSGSLFAPHGVVTAAHCVYDRDTKSTISGSKFTPHNYVNAKRVMGAPFGSSEGYAFDFMSGWTDNDEEVAWVSDMAVILLQEPLGTQAGTLGYAYDARGYTGPITTAGYPGDSPRITGMYYRLKGPCSIQDTDGTDGQMNFKLSPSSKKCLTGCSIAERGQSGQPLLVKEGSKYIVRGVLSRGPSARTCRGFDVYTEVSAMHFNFLNKYSNWTMPA